MPTSKPPTAASTSGFTHALADFVAALSARSLPPPVRHAARLAMTDCIGVGLAGTQDAVTHSVASALAHDAGACTLWARAARASAADAALINGCAAHAHALDDTHESMRGHPSAPIVPAILALGEQHKASGDDVLTAYVAGVEVAARLGRSVNDRHAQIGWHTTSTLGAVGAAAACAALLRLDTARTRNALGIAASMAGGLRVNFGTQTKALHAGLAAQHGVLAAQLAASGVAASPTALEGHEGFLHCFCDDGSQDPARALHGLGASFAVLDPGIVVKRYPTCSLSHALIDLVLQAHVQGAFATDERLELHCEISPRLEAARARDWPRTGLAAKFHVQYCVAVAACRGTQGIADFSDNAVRSAPLRTWADHVRISVGRDFPADNGDMAALTVMRNGVAIFRQRQAKPWGHPSMPLSDAQRQEKFMQCATGVFAQERAAQLWRLLHAPSLCDARTLAGALATSTHNARQTDTQTRNAISSDLPWRPSVNPSP